MSTYLIAFAILVVAAFAQSVSGFGFALIAVPLMAVTVDPVVAVVTASTVNLAMTIVTWALERRLVDNRAIWPLVIGSFLGMPFGLIVLNTFSPWALTATIAVVTMACTVIVWRNNRPAASTHLSMAGSRGAPVRVGGGLRVAAAGVLAGVLTTSTGTNGPPLVAVLQKLGLEPRRFRATLAAIFTITGVVGALGFWATGEINSRVLPFLGLGLIASLMGGWIGNVAFGRIDKTRFRQLIIGALVVSSTIALMRVVAGSW